MYCQRCGQQNDDRARFCAACGEQFFTSPVQRSAPAPEPYDARVRCPRCQGCNIHFQREARGNVGAHTNTVVVKPAKQGHSLFYWLFIGWWLWLLLFPFKLILWPFKLLFSRKPRGGLGFSASKQINTTMAICGDCGYSWKAR